VDRTDARSDLEAVHNRARARKSRADRLGWGRRRDPREHPRSRLAAL